jgi:Uma2 family endonuclease
LTLEEFLQQRGIDEHPYKEFIDGRIEAKALPRSSHSILQRRLLVRLDQFATATDLGEVFPELRCTFAGRSIIPDLTFLLRDHIPRDEQGRMVEKVCIPPDVQIEIVSPEDSVAKLRQKLIHGTSNGCSLGILIHPKSEWVEVYGPSGEPHRLGPDGSISGEPVLPGFQLAVKELFGWLGPPRKGP